MSTFVCNLVHFVWGTANREPLLRKSWRDKLHGYIGGVLANKKAKLLAAGGIEDHMHVLASLPATISLSEAANAMKANSSRWIHENAPQSKGFEWQAGYGDFLRQQICGARGDSLHPQSGRASSPMEVHRGIRGLLQKHGIPYEERYLWV